MIDRYEHIGAKHSGSEITDFGDRNCSVAILTHLDERIFGLRIRGDLAFFAEEAVICSGRGLRA